MVPVSELAEMLAERSVSDDATDREWNRAVREKAQDIERAVDEGVVAAHRRGRRLLVNQGSFYDWLGEPVPIYPDWGLEYLVRSDEGEVERLKERFVELRKAVKDTPGGDRFEDEEPKRMARFPDQAGGRLQEAIRHGIVAK